MHFISIFNDVLGKYMTDQQYGKLVKSLTGDQKLLLHIIASECYHYKDLNPIDNYSPVRLHTASFAEPIKAIEDGVEEIRPFSQEVSNLKTKNRERLPNVPEEAYTIKDGKKVVDVEKLEELNDDTKHSGFRCPTCLSSSVITTGYSVEDQAVIKNPKTNELYVLNIDSFIEVFGHIEDLTDKSKTTKRIKAFMESDYIKDLILNSQGTAYITNDASIIADCLLCGNTHNFSEFIDANKNLMKYAEFLPCPICGSELESKTKVDTLGDNIDKNNVGLNNISMKTSLTCSNEVCGYSI